MLAVISHGMSSRIGSLGNKAWQSSNLLGTSIRLVRSLAGVHRKPTVSQPYGTRSLILSGFHTSAISAAVRKFQGRVMFETLSIHVKRKWF